MIDHSMKVLHSKFLQTKYLHEPCDRHRSMMRSNKDKYMELGYIVIIHVDNTRQLLEVKQD